MELPSTTRAPLEGRYFQVAIIGGGINGAAIARECARARRRVLLVEQDDFGAGTTCRSTRIIHGGLRYLEHGEIGLVRESLRERQRLLQEFPHLVRTREFLLALGEHSRRSALLVRLGLWLYRRLGGKSARRLQPSRERERFERLLDSGHRWSMFSFDDAQCEFPERLVAAWMGDAARAGAMVRNHSRVLAVDVVAGRAVGLLIRDLLSGRDERIRAGWVINASGPWADRICQRSGIQTPTPMIGGVRGSHIILPQFREAPEAAVLTEAMDGRPIFVIPWNGQLMVGTTEVPDSGDPGTSKPSLEEIRYLLSSLRTLLPDSKVGASDIRYACSGVRPLPFAGKESPSLVTRRHFLHDHANDGVEQMISIIGGKLTTAAELGRQCARKIGIRIAEPRSATVLPYGEATLDDFIAEIASAAGIAEDTAEAIAEWYGSHSLEVARLARTGVDMKAKLCAHSGHMVAEAVYAMQHEYACTLGDVLLRRVPVALGACWSEECGRLAAGRIGAALGWTQTKVRSAFETFENERHEFLVKPESLEAAQST
ncbi:MAG: glycerol-3-phosphate dehydrogenase/oxidase [Acidobacteria bacterium]|nr:glycerol-3-phosphate dehydrogenase/oxidase [Acidobacteriota bacterium]MBV9480459.1 glycerol-3-phosphate dehydrogenase/oxidase [Acidobacteriota bacterium]